MSNTQHTPGPWFADTSFVGSEAIDRFFVSCHSKDLPGGRNEAESNARLIAAAPALLEALQDVAARLPVAARLHPRDLAALQAQVCAAIRQATGQE